MQTYTVHEPPEPPIERLDRAGSLTFIADRFTPAAAAFGPLWLAAHWLWHALAIYFVAFVLVTGVVLAMGLSPRWLMLMVGALNLITGFEAASLRRWALERRGWRTLGTVTGRSIDECERRFLESWLSEQRLTGAAGGVPGGPGVGMRLAGVATGEAGGRLGAGERRGWLSWPRAR